MVQTRLDQIRAFDSRTQYLRSARQSRIAVTFLAVAADVAGREGSDEPDCTHAVGGVVLDGLGRRFIFDLPGRSFLPLRTQAGIQPPEGQRRSSNSLQVPRSIQDGAPSLVPGIYRGVLEHSAHDLWTSVLRHHDHRLHSSRDSI